jgi:hypothetical protein
VRETRRRSALAFQEWSCKLEMPEEWGNPANAGPSKASCASVRCEVREEVCQAPSHPLQTLLGASQRAFCASPR